VYVEGERVIVPVQGKILERRKQSEMDAKGKKRFDIALDLPDVDVIIVKEYDTEEIECYDAEVSEELRELGSKVIDKMLELSHISEYIGKENICYVLSYEPKKDKDGKITLADCRLVNGPYRALLDFRYIITFYEPNIYGLSDNQKKLLMLHELKHIGEDGKIRPHTIEDFGSMLERFGVYWNRDGEEVPDILT
jgi:hypothetical protein